MLPQCGYIPPGILMRQTDNQLGDLAAQRRPPGIAAVLRAVELLSDELPIPGQDRIRLGYASNLLERSAPETFADFCKRSSLRIGQPEAAGRCARRILFSAAKCLFCSRTCWFTIPVTYANSRATCVFFMESDHHSLPLLSNRSNILTLRAKSSCPRRQEYTETRRGRHR